MERSPWEPEAVAVAIDEAGGTADESSVRSSDAQGLLAGLLEAREVDKLALELGLSSYASTAGEESALVALGQLLTSDEWVFPGARDLALARARALPWSEVVGALVGDLSQPALWQDHSFVPVSAARGIAPASRQLAMHLALAAGYARGQKLSRVGRATVAICGEGSTTTGIFHETAALASFADLPLVIICKSQVWPEGAPAEAGMIGDNVAERAKGCGLWSQRVDGADIVGVSQALSHALSRAREGAGAAVVEVCVTRLAVDPPLSRDPITRLSAYLTRTGLDVEALAASVRAATQSAFASALALTQRTRL